MDALSTQVISERGLIILYTVHTTTKMVSSHCITILIQTRTFNNLVTIVLDKTQLLVLI